MTPACEDWRGLSAREATALVAAEMRVWRRRLDWDVTAAWSVIEPGRAAGRLPGFVARDGSGRVTGWTCFHVHRRFLQVAMLVSESRDVTSALLEAILSSTEAACATSFALSVRDAAPGLREALTAQGLRVTTYRYLNLEIQGFRDSWIQELQVFRDPEIPESLNPEILESRNPGILRFKIRSWLPGDVEPTARLCARAYARARDVRAFVVDGGADHWLDYVIGLVTRPGCGSFLKDASFVSAGRQGELDAAILTTAIGPRTSHIAQIAVSPSARRCGLGRALMQSAISRVTALGHTRMTLLVAQANTPAVRLYEHLGFRDRFAFVVAASGQPRGLAREGLAAAGASTRP